jgi:hypothetical protein
MSFFELENPESEEVNLEVLLLGAGNSGALSAQMFMEDIPRSLVPGWSIRVVELDLRLLKLLFGKKREAAPNETPEETAARENFNDWLASDNFVAYYCKDLTGKHKVFGAGGDPVEGKRILEQHKTKIMPELKRYDFIFLLGGADGGTAGPALPLLSGWATEEGIPHLTTVMAPGPDEGERYDQALSVWRELQDGKWPAMMRKSEGFSDADRKLSLYKAFKQRHRKYRAQHEAFRKLTQKVGWFNADHDDLKKYAQGQTGFYLGQYEGKHNEAELDGKEIAKKLLSDEDQNKGIHARKLIFLYEGDPDLITLGLVESMEDEVKKATSFTVKGRSKRQVCFAPGQPLTVDLFVFGYFPGRQPSAANNAAGKTGDEANAKLPLALPATETEKSAPAETPATDIPTLPQPAAEEPIPTSSETVKDTKKEGGEKPKPKLVARSTVSRPARKTISFNNKQGKAVTPEVDSDLADRFVKIHRYGADAELREATYEEVRTATGERPPKWGESPETPPSRMQQLVSRFSRRPQTSTSGS